MTDILSWLPTVTMPVYAKDERGDLYPMTNAITWVKRDDVAEALTNPTDERVEDIARYWLNEHYQTYDTITGQFGCVCGSTGNRDLHLIRVCLAAAAGGDDE